MGISVNQSLTIVSKDASSNTAQVRYVVTCTTSGDSWNGNTQTGTFGVDGVNYNSSYTLPQNTTTTVFDKTVTVSNASEKTVVAAYNFPTTSYYGTQAGDTSVYIDLPRYANFTQHYVKSTSIETAIIKWSADSNIDFLQYSINGSSWINTSGSEYTIRNLSPNTSYNIKTRIRRADSQLWTESGTIVAKTKDYSKITYSENMILGEPFRIKKTSSNGQYCRFRLETSKTIAVRENIADDTTITLTDEELDNLYKSFQQNNEIAIRYVIDTKENNTYYSFVDKRCILQGNQKTAYIKVNNANKRAKVFININGTIKRAVIWAGVNGTPKRCI